MKMLLQRAREIQAKMRRELDVLVLQEETGDGAVRVRMNGHKVLLAIEIAPELFDPAQPERIEELVRAAVNQVSRRLDAILVQKVGPNHHFPSLFH